MKNTIEITNIPDEILAKLRDFIQRGIMDISEESLKLLKDLIQDAVTDWNSEECKKNAVIIAEVRIENWRTCAPIITFKK